MDSQEIQAILTARHAGDHTRVARIAHFMGLLKSGVDGMATMGVVINLEVPSLTGVAVSTLPAPANVLSSIETAIAHMTHATHQ